MSTNNDTPEIHPGPDGRAEVAEADGVNDPYVSWSDWDYHREPGHPRAQEYAAGPEDPDEHGYRREPEYGQEPGFQHEPEYQKEPGYPRELEYKQ